MAHFLAPLLTSDSVRRILLNTRTGRAVATTLEPAFDSAGRRTGLLGRTELPPGTALILAPCAAVHTCFMRFPIDVVFVRRDGAVTKVCRQVRPWRMAVSFGAFATVELATNGAGDVRPGDVLAVEIWENSKSSGA